jgi:hypothetical protein
MQASALQHTLVMKANLGSFERFASSLSSCFGRVPELFVESKSALERPQQGLDGGVHLAAASTAPSAHHRYRTVLFRAFLHVFSCSGGVSERILARKGVFDAPDRDLAGDVRCAAAAQASRRYREARSNGSKKRGWPSSLKKKDVYARYR